MSPPRTRERTLSRSQKSEMAICGGGGHVQLHALAAGAAIIYLLARASDTRAQERNNQKIKFDDSAQEERTGADENLFIVLHLFIFTPMACGT